VLRRARFLHGRAKSADGLGDILWFAPDGKEMTTAEWRDAESRCVGLCLNGEAGNDRAPDGRPLTEGILLVLFNAHAEAVSFVLPAMPRTTGWRQILDTDQPDLPEGLPIEPCQTPHRLPPRSLAAFLVVRAEAPAPGRAS